MVRRTCPTPLGVGGLVVAHPKLQVDARILIPVLRHVVIALHNLRVRIDSGHVVENIVVCRAEFKRRGEIKQHRRKERLRIGGPLR